ncbi:DUF397 domain-containing protein [Streptomyces sp. NPDC051913]|uniref:DUF397 domain-containing protein n=1 Tax=Streptomyces sp. NPDC051913 TaxID=3365676 RepID=UPI0037D18ABF
MTQPSSVRWRRSSYSNGMGGECLEMAALAETVTVRDSKVASDHHLKVRTTTWLNFIRTLASGHEKTAS